MVSKLQRSPSWLNSTSLMSKGMAPLSRATFATSAGSTNRMRACGSRKRWISHGQATRSIFGRRRVTQRLGRLGAKRSSSALATKGKPAFAQPSKPPSSMLAAKPSPRRYADGHLADLMPGLASDDDRPGAVELGRPVRRLAGVAPDGAGNEVPAIDRTRRAGARRRSAALQASLSGSKGLSLRSNSLETA